MSLLMEIAFLPAESGRSPRLPGSKPVLLAQDLCASASLRLCVKFVSSQLPSRPMPTKSYAWVLKSLPTQPLNTIRSTHEIMATQPEINHIVVGSIFPRPASSVVSSGQ